MHRFTFIIAYACEMTANRQSNRLKSSQLSKIRDDRPVAFIVFGQTSSKRNFQLPKHSL